MPSSTPPTCIAKEPFIKLADGQTAPVINYTLPQSTCFNAHGEVILNILSSAFLQTADDVPATNFWSSIEGMSINEITEKLNNDIIGFRSNSLLGKIKYAQIKPRSVRPSVNPVVNLTTGLATTATKFDNDDPEVDEEAVIDGLTISQIANQCANGFKPVLRRNLWGTLRLSFLPQPITPVPQIKMLLHYKMCTYAGNFGAGKVIKTMTLLPGEKTTISFSSYKNSTETYSKSENVLDSYTETSSEELETILSQETALAVADSFSATSSSEIGGSLDVGLNLGLVNIGVSGGGSSSNTMTLNASSSTMVNNLSSAVDQHTEQSSATREITVNTETTFSTSEGFSESIVREIENINYSRTLNFVFRQLLQEYITITYLDQVSFVFTNGYPESTIKGTLQDIDGFLSKVLLSAQINSVRTATLNELASVYDYTATRQAFIEKITEPIVDVDNPSTTIRTNTYYRKKRTLSQTAEGFTVPGIIMEVKKRMMRTDAIIGEALLGSGEALDCYNMKLQDAATSKAYLENDVTQQQIDVINGLTAGADKADKYKKVFGECCDTPQTEEIP